MSSITATTALARVAPTEALSARALLLRTAGAELCIAAVVLLLIETWYAGRLSSRQAVSAV